MFELQFYGAAREVTGSCHIVRLGGKTFLLDCGLFQGKRADSIEKNRTFGHFEPSEVHSVVLSHAHIDHAGRLPMLAREGFEGMIYTTGATVELSRLMLLDSAHIQEKDVEFLNKRRRKRHEKPVDPLYTRPDAERALEQFIGMPYGREFSLLRNLRVRFEHAGHILGAAWVGLDCNEFDRPIRLVFSGDIGRMQHPFLREPEPPENVDYLVLESTYGNRLHETEADLKEKLRRIVHQVWERKSKLIVPAFSVGRTQLIIWYLNALFNEGKLPRLPVYVDSPLSTNATEIFRTRYESFSEDFRSVLLHDDDPFGFRTLTFIRDVEKSKALNEAPGPMMIVSASGMCEAGRILHHLRNNIEDPKNIVLIVGFMAEHTLGRRLIEGRDVVKIFGEEHHRRCQVEVIDGFSAHGDQSDLVKFAESAARGGRLRKIFLVHGEEESQVALKEKLAESLPQVDVVIPEAGRRAQLQPGS